VRGDLIWIEIAPGVRILQKRAPATKQVAPVANKMRGKGRDKAARG